ncbi:hypothetical protein Lser_V15G40933 [Lactuca serriola]
MYGVPPMMDRYLPLGHTAAMGPRPGFYPEEKAKKDGKSENDWVCPNCGNVNFSFRTVCNMRKCNTPKPGSKASKSGNNSKGDRDMPDGSWKCDKCNNITIHSEQNATDRTVVLKNHQNPGIPLQKKQKKMISESFEKVVQLSSRLFSHVAALI